MYSPALVDLADTDRRYDFHPGIFAQYDDTGFGEDEVCEDENLGPRTVQRYHLRDASDWQYMIDHAGLPYQRIAVETRIASTCDVTEFRNTNTSILWVYSYNEWGEGAGIEELQGPGSYPFAFGTGPLATLRDAVSAGPPPGPPPPPVQRNPEGYVDGLRARSSSGMRSRTATCTGWRSPAPTVPSPMNNRTQRSFRRPV